MRSVFGAIEVPRAYALRNDFVSCKAVGRWPVVTITGTLPTASEGDAAARPPCVNAAGSLSVRRLCRRDRNQYPRARSHHHRQSGHRAFWDCFSIGPRSRRRRGVLEPAELAKARLLRVGELACCLGIFLSDDRPAALFGAERRLLADRTFSRSRLASSRHSCGRMSQEYAVYA